PRLRGFHLRDDISGVARGYIGRNPQILKQMPVCNEPICPHPSCLDRRESSERLTTVLVLVLVLVLLLLGWSWRFERLTTRARRIHCFRLGIACAPSVQTAQSTLKLGRHSALPRS